MDDILDAALDAADGKRAARPQAVLHDRDSDAEDARLDAILDAALRTALADAAPRAAPAASRDPPSVRSAGADPATRCEPQHRSQPAFALGDRVKIQDLSRAPEHNGRVGTVVGFSQTGRVRVRLHGRATPLGLKPYNLAAAAQTDEAKGGNGTGVQPVYDESDALARSHLPARSSVEELRGEDRGLRRLFAQLGLGDFPGISLTYVWYLIARLRINDRYMRGWRGSRMDDILDAGLRTARADAAARAEIAASRDPPSVRSAGGDPESDELARSHLAAPVEDRPPSAEELCGEGTGISLAGIVYCIDLFVRTCSITDETSTSELCHAHIKPATTPHGWRNEAHVTNAEKGWYEHSYVDEATGLRQSIAPRGTRSMCSVLAADPATAHFVGKPTHFLSHAWVYKILNVVAALGEFVNSLPADSPEPFFWFDTFAIDEHASQDRPQVWWSTTFQRAIELVGHTVMMLTPWHAPQPLTRAWCLWELYCTHKANIPFSVCLGPVERLQLENAVWIEGDKVYDALSNISVEDAQAGSKSDEEMIKKTVAEQVGFSRLNSIVLGQMRAWILTVCRKIAAEPEIHGAPMDGLENLTMKGSVANLLTRFELFTEAEKLYREVHAAATEQFGPQDLHTLANDSNLATRLSQEGTPESLAEATALYRQTIPGLKVQCGPAHLATLTAISNFANVLGMARTPESLAEAKKILREAIIADEMEHHGRINPPMPTTDVAREQKPRYVANIKGKLALVLHEERTPESLAQAKDLYYEVIASETELNGSGDLKVLRAKANLASLLMRYLLLCNPQCWLSFGLSFGLWSLWYPNVDRRRYYEFAHDESDRLCGEAIGGLMQALGPDHHLVKTVTEGLRRQIQVRIRKHLGQQVGVPPTQTASDCDGGPLVWFG